MKTRTMIGPSAALALVLAAGTAAAGPEGASVAAGSATFGQSGSTTTITAADGTIINFNSFNIGSGETVQFIQPSATATVLNRINGGSPTVIDGALLANGRVWLVNPSGVMFGQNAVVNVGHLYAAAANLTDSDFLAGRNNFTGATGEVVNHGSIQGDFVGLIGARVANHGTITADRGTVIMAAGNEVYISERLGQWHVKVDRTPADAGSTASGPGLAAGDSYTLAAWHDGVTTAQNVHIASAGDTAFAGTVQTGNGETGMLALSGNAITIDNSGAANTVSASSLEQALDLGMDVFVQSSDRIEVLSDVLKTAGDESTLSYEAANALLIAGDVINTSGSALNLKLRSDGTIDFAGNALLADGVFSLVAPSITLDANSTVTGSVIELFADNQITGTRVTFETNSTIADLSAEGFASLSEGLQAEMTGTPSNQDLAILLTADDIALSAPSVRSTNNGGMRLFANNSASLDSVGTLLVSTPSIDLDGRFLQEGPAAISLSGEVMTTGDSILFAGDVNLNGDALLASNGGLIGFEGTVDGGFFLSADAGFGSIVVLENIGGNSALDGVRMRGENLNVFGSVTTTNQQLYTLDRAMFAGDLTATSESGGVVEMYSFEFEGDRSLVSGEATIMGDIRSHGMRIGVDLAIDNTLATLDTGVGTAWFGGDVFSAVTEGPTLSSVEFVYSGDPEVDLGSNRTPFTFAGFVGARSGGYGVEGPGGSAYAFRNITFGGDRAPAAAASFLFASQAVPGTDLTPGTGGEDFFYVYATDNITASSGQKLTAFGDLTLATGTESFGTISLSDVNTLGNLVLDADRIVLNSRAAGGIEGLSTEQDRLAERDVELIQDLGAELIAGGTITLNGELQFAGDGSFFKLDASSIQLADEGSFRDLTSEERAELTLFDTVDEFLFAAGSAPVRSTEGGLYAYDLAITGALTPVDPGFDPNLGLGFNGVDRFDPRYAERIVANDPVLQEVGLNTRSHASSGHRDRALNGTGIIADIPANPNPGLSDYTVTLDRLSQASVQRLKTRYNAVFGPQLEDGSGRANTENLHNAIAQSWTTFRSQGGEDGTGFASWAYQNDPQFFQTLVEIRGLLDAVESLGLNPLEMRRARARTLDRIRPTGLEYGIIDRMINGLDQLEIPEGNAAQRQLARR